MLHLRVRDSGEYFIYYGPSIIAPVMLEKELHEGRDFCFVHGSSPQGSALFGLCTIGLITPGLCTIWTLHYLDSVPGLCTIWTLKCR